jgi:site-specific recombinases, DNA invertase pin homologs
MCVNGKGAPTIAKVLEEKGILNPAAYKTLKGSTRFVKLQGTNHYKWKAVTVRKILTDMVYCGHMENGKYKVENYKTKRRVKVPDSEHIVVKNTHEAIISEETFETVQTVLSARHYPAHHEHENLFKTGLFMMEHRYYNPELGRWISPDDVEYLDPEFLNGLNLYCYCLNIQ